MSWEHACHCTDSCTCHRPHGREAGHPLVLMVLSLAQCQCKTGVWLWLHPGWNRTGSHEAKSLPNNSSPSEQWWCGHLALHKFSGFQLPVQVCVQRVQSSNTMQDNDGIQLFGTLHLHHHHQNHQVHWDHEGHQADLTTGSCLENWHWMQMTTMGRKISDSEMPLLDDAGMNSSAVSGLEVWSRLSSRTPQDDRCASCRCGTEQVCVYQIALHPGSPFQAPCQGQSCAHRSWNALVSSEIDKMNNMKNIENNKNILI